jgi:hypothetical protein
VIVKTLLLEADALPPVAWQDKRKSESDERVLSCKMKCVREKFAADACIYDACACIL